MVLFFKDCQFTVDFTSQHFPYQRKKEIRRRIIEHGGTISYILNSKTKFFVSANKEIVESYKGRTALKLGIPIVWFSFIDKCTKQQKLLDSDDYLLVGKSATKQFSSGVIKADVQKPAGVNLKPPKPFSLASLKSTRVYLYNQESDISFPTDDYEIIKYAWFKKADANGLCCFVAHELHISTASETTSEGKPGPTHRIFSHQGVIEKGVVMDVKQHTRKECRFASNPDVAEQLFSLLCEQQVIEYPQQFSFFPSGVGSNKMISNNISSQISNNNSLSPCVKSLVHSIWSDAIGELTSLLEAPVERLKLEDVDKAEGILQAIREILDKNGHSQENLKKYSDEFYSLVPHSEKNTKEINTKRVIAEKQDLCQLIKDMLSVSEATNFSPRSSDEAKYKALGCHLQSLSKSTDEYRNIVNRVHSAPDSEIKVENIFTCRRSAEAANFPSQFDNVRQLFHSSKAQNFLGILSRGLLLPKLVVSDYGGERSDAGSLGTGIYFGDEASTSVKYSSPGQSRGSRFLLICDVALGRVKDYTEFASELESAPEGYQSCHGVKNEGENFPTQFKQDEYVVYAVNQQRIRYLVEFTLPQDDVITGVPDANQSNGENVLCEPTTAISLDEQVASSDEDENIPNITTSDIENVENPLEKVKPGLRFEGDSLVPLQSVHIRAKLLDLCAKVVVMQVYKNSTAKPIEAKYVFPLDDMAAVCGFEAFINGKHIVGEVKEKEQAHKEYKKAISEGHGAYLMDEETPDVFTVSVGNIPPGATVLIKITYVAELPVEDENILFNLPGSLAPWSRDQALKDSTQDVVESVEVDYDSPLELSIHICVEMPFDIKTLDSPTHDVRIKKTAAKAVIEMKSGQSMADGFQLLIGLAEIHVPRMWAESDPNNSDSRACMLSFYPEFEAESMENIEYVFLLDMSCSMKGTPLENAKKILLLALTKLPAGSTFNIVAFGSQWLELFPSSLQKSERSLKDAAAFIKRCNSDMGATDMWKVLKALSLLPVKYDVHVRNVCILSDGHVTEEELSLQLASDSEQKSRIFTFGVGSSANRYFLRTVAKLGAGACEYFDSKVKSKWQRKVESLLTKSQQPVLTSVSVAWQQFDDDAPTPIQAPSQILSLFNGSRQVVYGFVPHCTQATLKAKINGKEISTMVSTSELSATCGTTLHQLTARALINDWEEGLLAPDHLHHQALKISRKDYIIEISKKYSVTSKFTSFVAIEKREDGEIFDPTTAPDVQDILDGESVDILGYIGWPEETADLPGQFGSGKEPCSTSAYIQVLDDEESNLYGYSDLCADDDSDASSDDSSCSHFSDLYDVLDTCSMALKRSEDIGSAELEGGKGSSSSDSDFSGSQAMSLRFENPVYKSSASSQILSEILIRKKAPFEEDSYCSFSVDSILGDAGELKATTASRDVTEIEEEAAEEELPDFFSSMTTCLSKSVEEEMEGVTEKADLGKKDTIGFEQQQKEIRQQQREETEMKLTPLGEEDFDEYCDEDEYGCYLPTETPTAVRESTKMQSQRQPRKLKRRGPVSYAVCDSLESNVSTDVPPSPPLPRKPSTSPVISALSCDIPAPPHTLLGAAPTTQVTLSTDVPPPPPFPRKPKPINVRRSSSPKMSPLSCDIPPPRPLGAAPIGQGTLSTDVPPPSPPGPSHATYDFIPPPPPKPKPKPDNVRWSPMKCALLSRDIPPPQRRMALCIDKGLSKSVEEEMEGVTVKAYLGKKDTIGFGQQQKEIRQQQREEAEMKLNSPLGEEDFHEYCDEDAYVCYLPPTAVRESTKMQSQRQPAKLTRRGPVSYAVCDSLESNVSTDVPPSPPLPRKPSTSPVISALSCNISSPPPPLLGAAPITQGTLSTDVPPPPPFPRKPKPVNVRRSSSPKMSPLSCDIPPHRALGAAPIREATYDFAPPPPLPPKPKPKPDIVGSSPPVIFALPPKVPPGAAPATQKTVARKSKQCWRPRSLPQDGSILLGSARSRVPRVRRMALYIDKVASKSPNEETLVDLLGKDDGEYLEPMDTSGFGQKQKAKVMNESPFGVRRHLSGERSFTRSKSAPRPAPMVRLKRIFELQNEDGSWSLPDSRLDIIINIKTEKVEQLLIECGAKSLGTRIFSILCKMMATMLVLVYVRDRKPSACPVSLTPPFKIPACSDEPGVEWQAKIAKAMTWLKTADKLVPCVCTRLQLGNNWETVIPKLLHVQSSREEPGTESYGPVWI